MRHALCRYFSFLSGLALLLLCQTHLVSSSIAIELQAAEALVEPQSGESPTPSQETSPSPQPQEESSSESGNSELREAPDSDSMDPPSEAERITELQETIEEDQKQLSALEMELENPESDYSKAEKEFRELNDELDAHQKELEAAEKSGSVDEVERIKKEIDSIELKRKLAQELFDLEIESRKNLREEIHALKSKIKKDQDALDVLTGEGEDRTEKIDQEKSESENSDKSNQSQSKSDRDEESKSESKKDDAESEDENSDSGDEETEEDDEEMKAAKAAAEVKEQEAKEAEEETKSLEARMSDLQKLVNQEQKEQALARRKVDLTTATIQTLSEEIIKRQTEKADAAELADLQNTINETNQRLVSARSELAEIAERLNEHRAELNDLQNEHILALQEAKLKQQEAKDAEDRVSALSNPFALRNMLQWLLNHAHRLIAIVVGMFLINRVAHYFSMRSIQLVTSGPGRGTKQERENRAKTLVGVFQNAATVAIFISGCLMILEEVGANITVLMGGVAVVGLAVAFGAQNLIKDYFYGFVMLLENQYMLNDTIQIGGVSGQVERITLRMTVLRDSNGVVHFIPNGTINSVSNETHGWSRAVCEISVSYDDDLDRVLNAIREIGVSMTSDPNLRSLILDQPAEPSIESLGESSIRIKTAIKTLPNKHGSVKQEWMRRVHRRFQELNIAPAYPRQNIVLEREAASEALSLSVQNRVA